MSQPDYRVVKESLNVPALERKRIIYPIGNPVAAITIVQLPTIAVGRVFLHFGENGDAIPLRHEAFTWTRTPPRDDGIFLTIEAGLGAVELIAVVGVDMRTES